MRHNRYIKIIGLYLVFFSACQSFGQRQLVMLSGGRPVHCFKEGESFKSKLYGEPDQHWGFLVEISEFSIITSQDTIELKKIRKVLLPGKPRINRIGKLLITIGSAYFLIDQFNNTVVQHHDPSLDPDIWKPAAIIVGAGLPLLLIKKKWKKISRGVKLISIDKDSKYYQPDS